jgi:selenide,water dikinase
MLNGVEWPTDSNLLVGIDSRDDAGVYRLSDELAIIQTIDFFTPMVDDPYIFGQIAAVNALNDVYAMGGQPFLAMNIVCYPQCGDMTVLRKILEGGLSKVKEAGAVIVGGHTVDDNEPKYGLSVCGRVHPTKVISNSTAGPGDILFLTKPLGNGVISTAIKAGIASELAMQEAIHWMSMLNRVGSEVMQQVGITAATDITGFGLAGHLYELAAASDVEIELATDRLRFMPGALEYASLGLIPAGAYTNRDYLAEKVEYQGQIDVTRRDLLFSPETAGGLLIAIGENKANALQKAMDERNCTCYPIGRVLQRGFLPIKITR